MDGEQPETAPDDGPADSSDDAPPPPTHLSPSSAELFEQCPRRWRLRYVERVPDPPGVAAVAGTFVHTVLEALLTKEPADRTVEEARSLATSLWPELCADQEFDALGLDARGLRRFKWRVWRAIEGLWALEDPATVEVVGTERRVTVELGEVPFVGILDRVHREAGTLVVSDYKSGRPPRSAFVPARIQQVLLYVAAFEALSGSRPGKARLLYLVGPTAIEADVSREAVAGAVDRLGAIWRAIKRALATGEFDPRPGVLCAWCPYLDRCPDGRAEVDRRVADGWVPTGTPAQRAA